MLSIKAQGVKGGAANYRENIGYCANFIKESNSEKIIIVDAFKGYGETYKKREFCNIKISENGIDLFDGTFDELKNILQNKNNL